MKDISPRSQKIQESRLAALGGNGIHFTVVDGKAELLVLNPNARNNAEVEPHGVFGIFEGDAGVSESNLDLSSLSPPCNPK